MPKHETTCKETRDLTGTGSPILEKREPGLGESRTKATSSNEDPIDTIPSTVDSRNSTRRFHFSACHTRRNRAAEGWGVNEMSGQGC
jgi:hypothetical protein